MALTDDIIALSLQTTRTMSGVEIVYHRGDDALTFDAIRNRHVDQAVDGGTIVAEAERIDWLFELLELADLSPAEPAQADWIEYGGEVWEVTEQPGIGYWSKIDPQREWCRVRTTQTAPGTVTPPDSTGANLHGLIVQRTAAESHDAYTVVALGAEAAIADPSDPDINNQVLAVATTSAAAGGQARYQIYGELVNAEWDWEPGPIYLAADGSLTQTPGDVQVGIAETANKVFFGVFAAGPTGPAGPAGTTGPNAVSAATTTTLVGLLTGDGSNVGYTANNTSNWDAAYGWGNHASAGYANADHNHNGIYESLGTASGLVQQHESLYSHVLAYGDGLQITAGFLEAKPSVLTGVIGITIDGGGSSITTGPKGYVRVPYACTITKVTLLANQSGSIVIDIWKDTFANAPPTDADSITSSAQPTLSSAAKSEDATLTGWTKTIAAGSVLAFNVDSATTVTRVTLLLDVTKN